MKGKIGKFDFLVEDRVYYEIIGSQIMPLTFGGNINKDIFIAVKKGVYESA